MSTNNPGLPKIWKEKGQTLKYISRQFAPFIQQDLATIVKTQCKYGKFMGLWESCALLRHKVPQNIDKRVPLSNGVIMV